MTAHSSQLPRPTITTHKTKIEKLFSCLCCNDGGSVKNVQKRRTVLEQPVGPIASSAQCKVDVRCLGLFSFYIRQHQDIQHIRHRSIEAPLNQWQFRRGELNMEDLKNLIAAADTAVKEGRKLSNKFLIDLFRALRKSKVTFYDMSGVKKSTICLALWFVSQSRVFTLL